MIITAQYANSEKTAINATIDGVAMFIPVDEGNRHYRMLLEENVTISDYVEQPISRDDVNAERDRRILLPKTIQPAGITTPFRVDMAKGGRENIAQLSTASLALKTLNPSHVWSFRDADNKDQTLTLDQMIEMGLQCMQQISLLHDKAKIVKNGGNIPADYTDDRHWT